jgi:Uma2 family endonuclease
VSACGVSAFRRIGSFSVGSYRTATTAQVEGEAPSEPGLPRLPRLRTSTPKISPSFPGGTRRQHASPQEIYLVIEVSDTTIKYDSGKKLHACENAAIQEYWIVDIPGKAIRVFRLNQKKKYHERRYREGSIAAQAFPDVLVNWKIFFKLLGSRRQRRAGVSVRGDQAQ